MPIFMKKNDIKKDGGVKVSDDMVAVYQIELTVVSPSSNNIHFVRYPYYYISLLDQLYFLLDQN